VSPAYGRPVLVVGLVRYGTGVDDDEIRLALVIDDAVRIFCEIELDTVALKLVEAAAKMEDHSARMHVVGTRQEVGLRANGGSRG